MFGCYDRLILVCVVFWFWLQDWFISCWLFDSCFVCLVLAVYLILKFCDLFYWFVLFWFGGGLLMFWMHWLGCIWCDLFCLFCLNCLIVLIWRLVFMWLCLLLDWIFNFVVYVLLWLVWLVLLVCGFIALVGCFVFFADVLLNWMGFGCLRWPWFLLWWVLLTVYFYLIWCDAFVGLVVLILLCCFWCWLFGWF